MSKKIIATEKKIPLRINQAWQCWLVSVVATLGLLGYQWLHQSELISQTQVKAKNLGIPLDQVTAEKIQQGLVMNSIFSLVVAVIYCVVGYYMWKGYHWARIVITILAVLHVVNLMTILSTQTSDNVGVLFIVISNIFGIIAAALLWIKTSREYFEEQKALRSQAKTDRLSEKYAKKSGTDNGQ